MRFSFLALLLIAQPAWADPCADVFDEDIIEGEEAVAAATEADPERYREVASYWSPDFAFNAVIGIEAPAGGERAAARLRAALPHIDMALGRAEAGPQIARGGAPTITLRLLDTPAPRSEEAWTGCDGRDCSVEFFPDFWRTASDDALAFTLAHEMFHVVQELAFPAVDHCHAYWWVEGTAEWFANLAVPGESFSAVSGFIEGWDRESGRKRLIDTDYSALGFWFWAGERFGPQFPLSLGAFGNNGLKDVAAISELLPPEDWADLVRIYLGGFLAYPDGRLALPVPDLGPDLSETGSVTLSGPAMSIQRARLALGPGLWRITRDAAASGVVVLVSDETGAGFSDLAQNGDEVTRFFGCGAGGTVQLAAAGGSGGDTSATLRIEEVEGGGCGSCLAGVWEMQVDRMLTPDEQTIYGDWADVARLDGGFGVFPKIGVADAMDFTLLYEWQGPRLTLSPDGVFVWNDPARLRHEGEGPDGRVIVESQHSFDGEIGRWNESDNRLNFESDTKLRMGAVVIEMPDFSSVWPIYEEVRSHSYTLPQGFHAICSGEQLVLERPLLPTVESTRIFRRVN